MQNFKAEGGGDYNQNHSCICSVLHYIYLIVLSFLGSSCGAAMRTMPSIDY